MLTSSVCPFSPLLLDHLISMLIKERLAYFLIDCRMPANPLYGIAVFLNIAAFVSRLENQLFLLMIASEI